MASEKVHLTVTYFPHTVLGEADLKRLTFYFSTIRLLQVSPDFDPGLPPPLRSAQLVRPFLPITEASLLEAIGRALHIYRQLGSVHQDGDLVQLLSALSLQEDLESSSTALVAHLRGAHPRLTSTEIDLVNDAVFLLLASELDREHLELDLEMDRVLRMESAFHEAVGIGAGEEAEAMAIDTPFRTELDRPRQRYPFQLLRAWTRLCSRHESRTPFLPLTTSAETIEEIFERLPPLLSSLPGRPPAVPPVSRNLLAILPDPETLSLKEIMDLRQSPNNEKALNDWWQALTAAISRLHQEILADTEITKLQQRLYGAAESLQQLWPVPRPEHFLRLEVISFPALQPHFAFSLATGLQPPASEIHFTDDANGVTLLLSPSAPPPGDRL